MLVDAKGGSRAIEWRFGSVVGCRWVVVVEVELGCCWRSEEERVSTGLTHSSALDFGAWLFWLFAAFFLSGRQPNYVKPPGKTPTTTTTTTQCRSLFLLLLLFLYPLLFHFHSRIFYVAISDCLIPSSRSALFSFRLHLRG